MKYNTYYKSTRPKKSSFRHNEIIAILSEKPLSMPELIEELNKRDIKSTEPSIKKDIAYLRERGYKIIRSKHLIYLENPTINAMSVVRETESNRPPTYILQFLIISLLSSKEMTKKELFESDVLFEFIGEHDFRCNVLGPLLDNNIIEQVPHTRRYRNNYKYNVDILPRDASIVMSLLDGKYEFPATIYESAIRYLEHHSEKIQINKTDISMFYKIKDYLGILSSLNYNRNPLQFTYLSSIGNKQHINFFFIGIIAYSSDKDELYLIGRSGIAKPKYEMFAASRIDFESMKISLNTNNFEKACKDTVYFRSIKEDFERISIEMFDINCDTPQTVSVKIKATRRNIREFEYLSAQRKKTAVLKYLLSDGSTSLIKPNNSNLSVKYLIYEDTIRGLGDFAKYLRRFGNDITILSDDKLKNQLVDSANRVLDNYNFLEK